MRWTPSGGASLRDACDGCALAIRQRDEADGHADFFGVARNDFAIETKLLGRSRELDREGHTGPRWVSERRAEVEPAGREVRRSLIVERAAGALLDVDIDRVARSLSTLVTIRVLMRHVDGHARR